MSGLGKSVFKGLAGSIAVVAAICWLLGIAELFADISDDILDVASVGILGVAAFSAGYIATQLYRSKGLLQGLLCGAGLFSLALILSLIFSEFEFRNIAVIKGVVCVIAGISGGVIGINTKKTKE